MSAVLAVRAAWGVFLRRAVVRAAALLVVVLGSGPATVAIARPGARPVTGDAAYEAQ